MHLRKPVGELITFWSLKLFLALYILCCCKLMFKTLVFAVFEDAWVDMLNGKYS